MIAGRTLFAAAAVAMTMGLSVQSGEIATLAKVRFPAPVPVGSRLRNRPACVAHPIRLMVQ